MFTQDELTTKTGPQLVEIFNGLPGVSQVKRFTNRETGVRRILEAQTGLTAAEHANQRADFERSLADDGQTTSERAMAASAPKTRRGRKKEERGTYNMTGGETKRNYRANSARGRLLAILTAEGDTFANILVRLPEYNEDTLHRDIKNALSRWLGFDITTDDNGVIRASREV